MKSGINNFIELLIKGDFFLIFLLVIVMIIISTIIYLIKLQMNEKMYYEDDEEDDELDNSITTKIETNQTEVNPKKFEQEKFNFDKETSKNNDDYIKRYEDEQEELAIISAKELENRIAEMKKNNEFETHEKRIEEYEQEQENKAIISYEELLKRATSSSIYYESEENVGGIKIGKVDTNKIETYSETSDKPYYKEEAFLESLKEFRRAL